MIFLCVNLEQRWVSAEEIRSLHPNKVPIIVERYKLENQLPLLDKSKYLVPDFLTVAEFCKIIRYIFVNMWEVRFKVFIKDIVNFIYISFFFTKTSAAAESNTSNLLISKSEEYSEWKLDHGRAVSKWKGCRWFSLCCICQPGRIWWSLTSEIR